MLKWLRLMIVGSLILSIASIATGCKRPEEETPVEEEEVEEKAPGEEEEEEGEEAMAPKGYFTERGDKGG